MEQVQNYSLHFLAPLFCLHLNILAAYKFMLQCLPQALLQDLSQELQFETLAASMLTYLVARLVDEFLLCLHVLKNVVNIFICLTC